MTSCLRSQCKANDANVCKTDGKAGRKKCQKIIVPENPLEEFVMVQQGNDMIDAMQLGSLGVIARIGESSVFIKDASIQTVGVNEFRIVG